MEEDLQEDHKIPYDENEENKSMNASKKVDASEKIEQNVSKIIKAGTEKYFLTCLDNLLEESKIITTLIGKGITRNWLKGMEKPAQRSCCRLLKWEGM